MGKAMPVCAKAGLSMYYMFSAVMLFVKSASLKIPLNLAFFEDQLTLNLQFLLRHCVLMEYIPVRVRKNRR